MRKGKGKSSRKPSNRGNQKREYDRGATSKSRDDDNCRNGNYDESERGRGGSRNSSRGMNDVSWYTRNPNLSVASASLPYPWRPGMSMPMVTGVEDYVIPGVMSLSWIPSVGNSSAATDPASIAAKEIYARVRAKFSGSLEADPPDFIMYLMALDSVFSYLAWLKRVYRTINAYTPDNYQLPDALMAAYGFTDAEISALRTNKTQLWQNINTLVLASRRFTCPALMDVMNRHYWMSDNVYLDTNSLNGQIYLFNQTAWLQYAEVAIPGDTEGNTAAGLVYKQLTTLDRSADGLYLFGANLINKLVAWDDSYTISGYLMRAYEGVSGFMVEELPQNELLTPVYEPEVLMQIENSRCVAFGTQMDITTANIAQNPLTNSVICDPTFKSSIGADNVRVVEYTKLPHMLTMRSDAPTVAENIIATRLHVGEVYLGESGKTGMVHVMCATEIPITWTYYTVGAEGTTSVVIQSPYIFEGTPTADTVSGFVRVISILSNFDWAPVNWVRTLNTAGTVARWNPIADVHNCTQITSETLFNIHRVCVFSEFNAFNF